MVAVPSAILSATLPVKPSVTTTSATPSVTSVPSTKPLKSIGRPLSRSIAAAPRTTSSPLPSSVPTLSSATRGLATPRMTRAKTSPMTANWNRCSAVQSTLAPRSRTTTGLLRPGMTELMAGRSMPGSVFRTNFAIPMRAPVLPAETAAAASPSFTALMASRMLVLRPWRSATDGLASPGTKSGVWWTVVAAASSGLAASRGPSFASSP